MIRNIIFDLSEVLIWGYYDLDECFEGETGISKQEFTKRKYETFDDFLDAMRGRMTENEYTSKLLDGTGWEITVKKFKELFRKSLDKTVSGTVEIVSELENMGRYRLILLSDHVRELVEYVLVKHRFLELFDEKIFSYEVGRLKSDKDSFVTLLSELKIDAGETLFIDDSDANVRAAEKVGIEGIRFMDADELRERLLNIGLL
jgi:HAD superfamily hydrolase (TIGR01509 family)